MATRVIGGYAKGCIAGAQALPVTGPAWQVMRLSRNRNWGHPSLVRYIERLAVESKQNDGWPGLLVGDLSQPRGGPMTFGHASHQSGLDVDIWYNAMPDRELSRKERDEIKLSSVLADPSHVDPDIWTTRHIDLIRRAASDGAVARVFVHPAIKKALCETVGSDRSFLKKVRPFWGHDDHFHVRLSCPVDSAECQRQSAVGSDDGCGRELDHWLRLVARPATTAAPVPAVQPPPQVQPVPARQPQPGAAVAPVHPAPSYATPPLPVGATPGVATYDSRATVQAPKGLDKLPAQCRVVLAAQPTGDASQHDGH